MRVGTLVVGMLLLLSQLAAAYSISSTNLHGIEPVLHGSTIAMVTFEDSIDTDLTNDGDVSDYVLQYYDIRTSASTNTGKEGKHPALFSQTLVFQDPARMLWLYDIGDGKATEVKARGTMPSVYSKYVAFATSEVDAGLDLNNDGDLKDTVIQIYNTVEKSVLNTKAVGASPLVLDDYVVFETREDLAAEDLNEDGDRDDPIIRAVDMSTGQILNTRAVGTAPVGYRDSIVVFSDGNQFVSMDIETIEQQPLGVLGNNPALYNDLLVYERGHALRLYRFSTGMEYLLDIQGTDPVMFEDVIAFVGEDKTITLVEGNDDDQDNVPDFADNCPAAANAHQEDTDKDNLGDACDETPLGDVAQEPAPDTASAESGVAAVTAQATAEQLSQAAADNAGGLSTGVQRKPLPDNLVLEAEEKEGKGPTYWFLVAVGLAVVGVLLYVVPRMLARRRKRIEKSFGF